MGPFYFCVGIFDICVSFGEVTFHRVPVHSERRNLYPIEYKQISMVACISLHSHRLLP